MPTRAGSTSNNDVLGELRALRLRVVDRIKELEPLEKELAELRETAQRFGLKLDDEAVKPAATAADKRPRRTVKMAPRRRPATRAGKGSRAEQVAQLVNDRPGITVPELGKALSVDSTGLYRVIRQLEQAGRVAKQGRQLEPTGASSEVATAVPKADRS